MAQLRCGGLFNNFHCIAKFQHTVQVKEFSRPRGASQQMGEIYAQFFLLRARYVPNVAKRSI